MIELLFVACLGGMPDRCNERSLLYTDITPMTCLMGAQPALADWVNQHPGYTIERWKCRRANPAEREA